MSIELAKAAELISGDAVEGFRAEAYKCPAGVWTIGYGTTRYPNGKPVKQGDTIGEIRARLYLMWHLEKEIKPRMERMQHWALMNSNQKAAIYSFAYNLGAGFYRARNFTSISTLCDSPWLWHDGEFVRHQFGKYVRAGGKTLAGLVRRRASEANLFLTPVSAKE